MASCFLNGLVLILVLGLRLASSSVINDPYPSSEETDTLEDITDDLIKLDEMDTRGMDMDQLEDNNRLMLPAQAPDPESHGLKRDEPYKPQTSMSEPPPRESVSINTDFIDTSYPNVDGGGTEEEANVDIVDINNLLPPDGLILPAQAPDPESPGLKRDEPHKPQTSMSEPPPRESVSINTDFIDASNANVDGGDTEEEANVDIVDINNLLPPDGLILPTQAPDPESPGLKRDEPHKPQTSMSEPPPERALTSIQPSSTHHMPTLTEEAQNLPHGLRIKRSKETLFSGKRLTSKRESG